MERLTRAWDAAWRVYDAITVIGWLLGFAGALGIMTAVLATTAEVPLHLVLFYGLGAFCFSSVSFVALVYLSRLRNIRGKVRVSGLLNRRFYIDNDGAEHSFYFDALIKNFSSETGVWVEPIDIFFSIEDRTSQEMTIGREPLFIPPTEVGMLSLPTIQKLPAEMAYQGRLRVKLRCGVSKRNMKYEILDDMKIQIVGHEMPDGRYQWLITPILDGTNQYVMT